jgi:hypothetical protein
MAAAVALVKVVAQAAQAARVAAARVVALPRNYPAQMVPMNLAAAAAGLAIMDQTYTPSTQAAAGARVSSF